MTRRAQRTGSVYFAKGRWTASYPLPPTPGGKRRRGYVYGLERREVERQLWDILAKLPGPNEPRPAPGYWQTADGRFRAQWRGPSGTWRRLTVDDEMEARRVVADIQAGRDPREQHALRLSRRPRRGTVSATVRFRVLQRCQFRCTYCGAKADRVELHVDHIVPVAAGGTDDESNLTAACVDCNLGKSDEPLFSESSPKKATFTLSERHAI